MSVATVANINGSELYHLAERATGTLYGGTESRTDGTIAAF
ncbi:hypothetical protein [Halobacillus dabanensis]|nr:hypothetical protein [Halobacillus dabanensis]